MLQITTATTLVFLAYLSYSPIGQANACNDVLCVNIVTKCQLTGDCRCDFKNGDCPCCKNCTKCLGILWAECCSCVELCPKPQTPAKNNFTSATQVEDLPNAIPSLFHSLVSEADTEDRWTSLTFPVVYEIFKVTPEFQRVDEQSTRIPEKQEVQLDEKKIMTFNCSVAFMTTCISLNKCKKSCESMGATSYRWFQFGCCECIGDKCPPYGLTEDRCKKCSTLSNDFNQSQLDFGEDDE